MEVHKTRQFSKWFARIKDGKTRDIIEARIFRITTSGDFGDYKTISNKVSELRIDYGPGYRIYFTKLESIVVILLIGGNKGTQDRNIKKAEKLATIKYIEENKK